MAGTIHVRGEGGQVIEMSLPLPDPIQQRLTKGLLRRVNPDGSPHTGPSPVPAGQPAAATGSPLTEGTTPRPAANARKAEWVGWAVGVHRMDPEQAESLSKADLMDLPDQPTQSRPGAGGQGGRPPEDAEKSEWIAHVVSLGLLSAEDAANYTKDDLIDLAN